MSPRRLRDHNDADECPDCGAPLLQCLCDADPDPTEWVEDEDDTEELDFDEEG